MQETHERQTSFNDNNYTPKQPVNTYKAAPALAVQQIASAARPRQQQRSVQRERTSKWIKSWNGGTNYLAEWISVNNHIDGTTVCANHKRGSIDYRECVRLRNSITTNSAGRGVLNTIMTDRIEAIS